MNAADEFSLLAIRVVVSFHAFVISVVVVLAFLMWRSHRKYEREAQARYDAFYDRILQISKDDIKQPQE